MKNVKKILIIFLLPLSLLSCGNPTVEEIIPSDSGIGGNRPVEPGPGDGGGGDDDDDGGTPGAKRIIIEVDGYAIGKNDLKNLKLPYKKKTVKPVPMGTAVKSKDCPSKHKHHCSKNRQVLVAFDLDTVTTHLGKYFISDIQLVGDFYSIGKNYRTELICLLHKKACSGRGIIKLPGLKLPWITKMLWWEKKFWELGYDEVVKTQSFHHLLEGAWNEDEGLYMLENANLKFNRLFGYTRGDLNSITVNQNRFVITVTDDTYIQNTKLIFKLVEDL